MIRLSPFFYLEWAEEIIKSSKSSFTEAIQEILGVYHKFDEHETDHNIYLEVCEVMIILLQKISRIEPDLIQATSRLYLQLEVYCRAWESIQENPERYQFLLLNARSILLNK